MSIEQSDGFSQQELQDIQQIREKSRKLIGRVCEIKDPQMQEQITNYFQELQLNLDFFTQAPESKYDEVITDGLTTCPSPSTKDYLIQMVQDTNSYVCGFASKGIDWGKTDSDLCQLPKRDLLGELVNTNTRLFNLTLAFGNDNWLISLPDGQLPPRQFISKITLRQIYQQGINVGLMHRLGIAKPDSYVERWGE